MAERMILKDDVVEKETSAWNSFGDNLEKEAFRQKVDEAFAWSQREMQSYGCPIKESLRLTEPEGYEDKKDATAAFFYDRTNEIMLLRRNWKSGELRYDEIANFGALCFEAKDFVDQMIENGITLSKLYKESGVQE